MGITVIHYNICRNNIISASLENKSLLCDRYYYSGIAYSTAQGLPFDWCNYADTGLMEADLVIFLDVNPESLAMRDGFGDEVFEKNDLQRKVFENFYKLPKKTEWLMVNGTMDEVHLKVVEKINEVYNIE